MRTTLSKATRLFAAAATLATSCEWYAPCGWDEHLAEGASYDVEIVERYSPESTTVFYGSSLDLTRPAESCGAFDEVAAGETFTVRLGRVLDCLFWNAEVTDPPVSLGGRLPLIINNRSHNQIVASTRRDFGGGCTGSWEFSVHAPEDDPFEEQLLGAEPVVVVYRVFAADLGADEACAALRGRPSPGGDEVVCGDAFVASMSTR